MFSFTDSLSNEGEIRLEDFLLKMIIKYNNLGKKGGKDKGRREGRIEGGKDGILGKKRGKEERSTEGKVGGWEGEGGWGDRRGGWQIEESFVAVGNCVAINT